MKPELTNARFLIMKREKRARDSYAIVKLAEFYGVSCDYLLGISDMRQIGKSGALEEIQIIRKHLDNLEKYLK